MPLCLLFFSPHKYRIESNNFLFSSLIMVYATELPDAIHRQNEVYIYIYIHSISSPSCYSVDGGVYRFVSLYLAISLSCLPLRRRVFSLSLSSGSWVVGCCSRRTRTWIACWCYYAAWFFVGHSLDCHWICPRWPRRRSLNLTWIRPVCPYHRLHQKKSFGRSSFQIHRLFVD